MRKLWRENCMLAWWAQFALDIWLHKKWQSFQWAHHDIPDSDDFVVWHLFCRYKIYVFTEGWACMICSLTFNHSSTKMNNYAFHASRTCIKEIQHFLHWPLTDIVAQKHWRKWARNNVFSFLNIKRDGVGQNNNTHHTQDCSWVLANGLFSVECIFTANKIAWD